MDLFLQFGHGMKSLTIDLANTWNGASVILSPRDMSPEQLGTWTTEFKKNNVERYFDPQFYYPKGTDIKQLSKYKYWDQHLNTQLQSNTTSIENHIISIREYNDIAETKAYILPSILNDYNETWASDYIRQLKTIVSTANNCMKDKPVLATLALPRDLLVQNESVIEPILLALQELPVDGYYVIAEAIDKKYLIDNPTWLSNVLHICASLKLLGKKVIYGYGNHQLFPLALLKIDAMASGTWLNVRSFTNRFIDVDEQKRRSTWVYYPEALSEYKLSFIDFAYNTGHLDALMPKNKAFLDKNILKIFSSVSPSSTGFTETDAFKHYLLCLKHQIKLLEKGSFDEAVSSYEMLLTTAEYEIEKLENLGIYASQARSFKNFIDVNRAAVTRLIKLHGFQLKMSWDTL